MIILILFDISLKFDYKKNSQYNNAKMSHTNSNDCDKISDEIRRIPPKPSQSSIVPIMIPAEYLQNAQELKHDKDRNMHYYGKKIEETYDCDKISDEIWRIPPKPSQSSIVPIMIPAEYLQNAQELKHDKDRNMHYYGKKIEETFN